MVLVREAKLLGNDINYYHIADSTNNRFHGAGIDSRALTTFLVTADTIYAAPFIVSKQFQVDTIQFEVTTNVAATNARIGIYEDNGSIYPGSLVSGSDVAQLATATTGVKSNTISPSITLPPGLYWLAFNDSGAVTVRAFNTTSILNILGMAATMGAGPGGTMYSVASAFGALPSTYPAGGSILATAPPAVVIRIP